MMSCRIAECDRHSHPTTWWIEMVHLGDVSGTVVGVRSLACHLLSWVDECTWSWG
jgi:hypothetical protein